MLVFRRIPTRLENIQRFYSLRKDIRLVDQQTRWYVRTCARTGTNHMVYTAADIESEIRRMKKTVVQKVIDIRNIRTKRWITL